MVPIKFASLILGLLLVLHDIGNSAAHTHPDPTATRENFVYTQKGQMRFGGRKMVADKELRRANKQEEWLTIAAASRISGKYQLDASKNCHESSQDCLNRQNNGNKQEPHDAHENEAQRFVEATDEIANLMGKDYGGMDKPRRRPPIHNQEPRD